MWYFSPATRGQYDDMTPFVMEYYTEQLNTVCKKTFQFFLMLSE